MMPAGSKYMIQASWDDVPHLSERAKKELFEATPPHLRAARAKGSPAMGTGAIYPVDPGEFTVPPFQIPLYWKRAFGLDVGWNRTAAIWGAHDSATDIVYLHTEHYRGQAEPSIHATAIRARGEWVPGAIDPAASGRSQSDGKQLLATYQALGLNLSGADNAVEAGIYQVWERLSTGRLKVFSTCLNWFSEYRLYRRDENGKIVKTNDHLMDATRYLIVSGLSMATVAPAGAGRQTGMVDHGRGDSEAGY